MKSFSNTLRKDLFSYKSLIIVIIILIACSLELIYGGDFGTGAHRDNGIFIMNKILTIGMMGAVMFAIPVIAVVPCLFNRRGDTNSKKTILAKSLATSITFSVTLIILYGFILMVKGLPTTELNLSMGGMFVEIYESMPVIYPLVTILGMAVFILCLSFFTFGILNIVKNKFVAAILSLIFFFSTPYIGMYTGLDNLMELELLNLTNISYSANIADYLIIYFILVGIGLLFLSKNKFKRRKLA